MTDYSNIDSLLEDHPLPWTSKYVRYEGTCFYDKDGNYVGTLESITPDIEDILPQLLGFYAAHRNKVATKEDQVGFLKADIGTLKQLINLVGEDDVISVMSLKSRLEQVEKELEYERGHEDGYSEGYTDGYDEGLDEGASIERERNG